MTNLIRKRKKNYKTTMTKKSLKRQGNIKELRKYHGNITVKVINDDDIWKMNHDRDRAGANVHDDCLDPAMNFRGSHDDDLHGGDHGHPDDDDHLDGDALGERNHDRPSGFCRMSGPDHFQWQDGADGCLLLGGRRLPVCWRQKNRKGRERGSSF